MRRWSFALDYLKKLGESIVYLPSEAEWEYACRAGTTTPYYFGDTITEDLANYNYKQTTDVGKFPANPFGLFDMCGNVWEWCQDEWHGNYNQAPNDGTEWLGSINEYKLLRGGSWYLNARDCRSASRNGYARADRYDDVGFRVVAVAVA